MEYINRKNAKDFIKKYCNKKDFNKALEIASRFKVRDVTITLNRAIKEYKLSKKSSCLSLFLGSEFESIILVLVEIDLT